MRNNYRILDNGTVVIDVYLNGEYFECLVSNSKLPKLLGLDVKWRAQKSTSNRAQTYYVVANVKQDDGSWGRIYLHRFLTDAPAGLVVDHDNHNGLDNRDHNIEPMTYAENWQNVDTLHPHNKSGHRGVHWISSIQRWQVQIMVGGKLHYGGRFTEDQLPLALSTAKRLQEENYTTMSNTQEGHEKAMKEPTDAGSSD